MNSAKDFNSKITTRIFGMRNGFTLVELVIVMVLIGILAAGAVLMFGHIVTQQQTDATLKEMQSLVNAMTGDPDLKEGGMRSSFGYAGDMGTLPTQTGVCPGCGLIELVERNIGPVWTPDAQLPGTGYGWRGPYIDAKQDDRRRYLALLDGWGNYYSYDARTGRITSSGPNGVLGDVDDIIWPGSPLASTGIVTGIVTGRVTDRNGNSVIANAVTVTYPNPASPGNSTTATNATDPNGVFTLNSIPIGKRKIQTVVGLVTYTKAVTVLPAQTVIVDFSTAEDPTIPRAPTAVTAARASLSSINLTWTAPTLNTDGTALVDLAGYNIYRSTDGVRPYPLLESIGLRTSFTDTLLTAGQRYFYMIRAVDKSGNKSIDSVESSTTVSPIAQTVAAATFHRATLDTCGYTTAVGTTHRVDFSILNRGMTADNITVTSVTITWGGIGRIRVVDSPAGGAFNWWRSPAAAVPSPANITLTTPFTINAGIPQTMRLCFDRSMGITDAIDLQMNTADGRFILY